MATQPSLVQVPAPPEQMHEKASTALAAERKAQTEARYLIAWKNPRDMDEVRQKLLKECARPKFAECGVYSKPVGKKQNAKGEWVQNFVTGLSIRFAESAQRALTNIFPERIVTFDDDKQRIVRVAVTDLEANVTHSKDIIINKTVERKNLKRGQNSLGVRLNSYGETVYIVEATEDEMLNKEGMLSAKVERGLTLKLLAGDIQEECIEAIAATTAKADKADPDAARKRLIDAFAQIGVKVEQLKEFLGAGLDTVQPAQIKELREIYTAIKEGETTWEAVMDRDEKKPAGTNGDGKTRTQTVAEKVAAQVHKQPAPAPAPAPKDEVQPMESISGDLPRAGSEAAGDNIHSCQECHILNGHASTCSQYHAPVTGSELFPDAAKEVAHDTEPPKRRR